MMNLKRVTELVAKIGELEANLTTARGDLIREVNGEQPPPRCGGEGEHLRD